MPTEEQTAELVARVSRADEAIRKGKQELKTAERAGIDVQARLTQLGELADKVKRVKTAYNI